MIDSSLSGAQRLDFEVYAKADIHSGVCTSTVEFTTHHGTCHRQCTRYSDCSEAEYESKSATPTSDRECTACSTTNCTEGEYVVSQCAPGGTTDFVCAPHSTCSNSTMFESVAPTSTSDRKCTNATVCKANQFTLLEKTKVHDRHCEDATICVFDSEYESVPLTANGNRVCASMATCDETTEFEAAAGTLTTDRQCRKLTVCDGASEFESNAPNATNDRECQPYAVCATPLVETVAPTATSDRECADSSDWSKASGLCVDQERTLGPRTRAACMDWCESRSYCTGITWGADVANVDADDDDTYLFKEGQCYMNGANCCRSETLVSTGILAGWETWLHTPRCVSGTVFDSASLGCSPSASRDAVDISASVPANNLEARAVSSFDAEHVYVSTNNVICGPFVPNKPSIIIGDEVIIALTTAEDRAAAGIHLCEHLCDEKSACVATTFGREDSNTATCVLYNTCTDLIPADAAQTSRKPDPSSCDQALCPTSRECETVTCSAGKCLVEQHPAGAECSDNVGETLGDTCSADGACVSGPCKDGQFALTFGTVAASDNDDSSIQKLCIDHLKCCANEYETSVGSATKDQSCRVCNQCKPWEFETQSCAAPGGRQCAAVQPQCSADEYEVCSPSSVSDRVCMGHTLCSSSNSSSSGGGEVMDLESAAPTSTSDRICRGPALPDLENFIAPIPWPTSANADSSTRMSWTSHATAEECADDCLNLLPVCHAFAFSRALSACVYFLGGTLPIGSSSSSSLNSGDQDGSRPTRADFVYYSRASHAALDVAIDLLSPEVHRQHGLGAPSATDDNGVYCVGAGTKGNGLLVAAAPPVGSAFRISIEVTIASGGNGYLVARSDGAGSRYFGLYVRSKHTGLTFYYTVAGSTNQLSVQFPAAVTGVDVADGFLHHVELWVSFTDVTVVLDGISATKPLEGPVVDCGGGHSSACITHVGQREGGYPLEGGCFKKADVASIQPIRGIPSIPAHIVAGATCPSGGGGGSTQTGRAPTSINLLNEAVHKQSAVLSAANDGGFCVGSESNGGGNAGGLLVAGAPATGSIFRVAVVATLPKRTFGYLFARSDSSGKRHFGLYVRPRHAGVVFYYRTAGSPAQLSAVFPTSVTGFRLADGRMHSVELWVSLIDVTLVVDGRATAPVPLDAPVEDCGAADPASCITHVGQREGGYPIVGGCVSSALVQPAPQFDLLNGQAQQCFAEAIGGHTGSSSSGIELTSFPIGKVGVAFAMELEIELGGGTAAAASDANVTSAGADPSTPVQGYVFSKGDGGNGRYYSLYIRDDGRGNVTPVFYYKTSASAKQRSVEFAGVSGIADGQLHTMVLSVDGSFPAKVMLLVDAKHRHVKLLDGAVDDCDGPGPDCTLHLGKRGGKRGYGLSAGCVSRAVLHPNNAVVQ